MKNDKLLFRHVTEYSLPDFDPNALVYHYTSPLGLKSILEHRELWASDYAFLNDKSENHYLYEVLQAVLVQERLRNKLEPLFLQKVEALISQKTQIATRPYYRYICSLSSQPDCLELWNYYTKTASGAGYNIGFSCHALAQAISRSDTAEAKCASVLYDFEKQRHALEIALIGYNEDFAAATLDEERETVFTEFTESLETLSAFLKHPGFAGENEVRICITHKASPSLPRKVNYRESNGIFIPFVPICFPMDAVKSVGLSPIRQEALSSNGIASMLLDLGYSNVSVEPSKIPLRN